MQKELLNKPLFAYDTSNDSQKMLQLFKIMQPKFISSIFIYVNDPLKRFLPERLQEENLGKILQEKLKDLNVQIQLKQIYGGKTTNDLILQTYLQKKCNIIFFGFTGLKGRKNHQMQFSSRVRQFVYDTKFQLALIKQYPKNRNSAIYCSDGSQISIDGLQKAIDFCGLFNLNLKVFHAFNSDTKKHSKQVKTALKLVCSKVVAFNTQVVTEQCNLVDYLKKQACIHDWVIITKNGYRGEISNKSFVGSHSTEIIAKVQANILLLN